MRTFIATSIVGSLLLCIGSAYSAGVQPMPFREPAKLPDAAEVLSPAAIHLDGWLGERLAVNATNRLLTVDTEPLLAGFRHKPGVHPWIGEHVGKWLHATTLAWAYTGDPRLRAKLDRVAAGLIAAQEPDGYLGTYVPEQRFGLYPGADWDVWSHKYCLIGLLTYYQFTGNEAALNACRKAADLLLRTFGPGKKSILAAGTHLGMAATSVLEPIVLLYRFTGEERYLDFARYIVQAWDAPNGPKIIQALLTAKEVNQTANGKAYEMLSNLVGLCELARATGDRSLLQPVLNAWQDIVTRRLYLTGGASQAEHFHGDYDLPNGPGASVSETCVTVTWLQLNLQLFRLTGEARYGDQLEKTIYNHLAAAQNPAGADWCYFTPLEGKKSYLSEINCCHSSGPRGMALAPQTTYLKTRLGADEALVVSTFETSSVTTELGGQSVAVQQRSGFPRQGESRLQFQLSRPARFAVRVRVPPWASPLRVRLNGKALAIAAHDGWAVIPARDWNTGDRLDLRYALGSRLVIGEHGNRGQAALTWGPFVLAYDEKRNPGLPRANAVGILDRKVAPPSNYLPGGELAFSAELRTAAGRPRLVKAELVPFADAGRDGGIFRVWLPGPGLPIVRSTNLLSSGQESCSRQGNVEGSINDGDADTFVVTFDGRVADEDWFAVALDEPVTIARVRFTPGKTFHDGGWFDASAGKPRIQVRRQNGGAWETVGEITTYPATTATDSAGLAEAAPRSFTVRLPRPVKAIAVRVIGKPACGDNPNQAFSSCAELQAFGE